MALTTDRGTILVEWRRRVRAGWGLGPHWHTIDGTAPLVGTLLDGSADPCAVLGELGRRCGHDGHPFDQVTAWTGELIDVLPRRLRRKVDQRRAAVALATGWAEGALERRHSRSFGVAPMGALRLALEQCYDRCESIGTNASDAYSLVVLDADSGLLPPVPRAPRPWRRSPPTLAARSPPASRWRPPRPAASSSWPSAAPTSPRWSARSWRRARYHRCSLGALVCRAGWNPSPRTAPTSMPISPSSRHELRSHRPPRLRLAVGRPPGDGRQSGRVASVQDRLRLPRPPDDPRLVQRLVDVAPRRRREVVDVVGEGPFPVLVADHGWDPRPLEHRRRVPHRRPQDRQRVGRLAFSVERQQAAELGPDRRRPPRHRLRRASSATAGGTAPA